VLERNIPEGQLLRVRKSLLGGGEKTALTCIKKTKKWTEPWNIRKNSNVDKTFGTKKAKPRKWKNGRIQNGRERVKEKEEMLNGDI